MSDKGSFMVAREVFSHPLFANGKPFSRREAWLWLVAEAAWKPRKVELGGRLIDLERGQLAHSVRFMAEAWGWSKSAVARFLDRLEAENMARQKTGTATGTSHGVLTICNYEAYQNLARDERDSNRDKVGTAAGQTRNIETLEEPPNPQRGETRRKAGADRSDPLFAEFETEVWARRWKRTGNAPLPAFKAYSRLSEADRADCRSHIAAAARAFEAGTEEKYRPLLATWINQRRWQGDLDVAAGASAPHWAEWVAAFQMSGSWNTTALGPPPGNPGCRVPREFLVRSAGDAA